MKLFLERIGQWFYRYADPVEGTMLITLWLLGVIALIKYIVT